MAVNAPLLERMEKGKDLRLKISAVKYKATNVLVNIVKKLTNRIRVSATDACRCKMIRYNWAATANQTIIDPIV